MVQADQSHSTQAAFNIPQTMRAVVCTDYGDNFDGILSVQDDVATPQIGDTPPSGFKNGLLVRVLAVALAPGDVRAMSGKTREFQGPPSFPYTPGGDVCGVVVAVPPEEEHNSSTVPNASNKTSSLFLRSPVNNCNESKCKFRVGDKIATRFVNKPMGALGEYALVSPDVCDCVPDGITPEGAAALVSSGTVAVIIADRIQEGDRVLIFGAGGGVGSHLCQMARLRGASYVAGVAQDSQRLMEKPLNCDYAIDYTTTDPFDVKEWRENPFDVIVDLSGGVWPRLVEKSTSQSIIKPGNKGGRYITTTPDSPIFEMHSIWAIMSTFMFPSLWRALSSRMRRWSLPKYSYVLALPSTSDIVTRTLKLGSESKLVPVIDTKGPFHFTTDGVREAFRLQQSYHAKGKVVIAVAKE